MVTRDEARTGVDLWAGLASMPTVTLINPDHETGLTSVALSANAATVAASDDSGRTYLWNTAAGRLLHFVRDPNGVVDMVAIGDVGRLLATAGTGNAIHFWDVATGAPLGTISDPGGRGVNSLAFNLMGTQLAADKNGTTYVWNLAS